MTSVVFDEYSEADLDRMQAWMCLFVILMLFCPVFHVFYDRFCQLFCRKVLSIECHELCIWIKEILFSLHQKESVKGFTVMMEWSMR